MLGSHTGMHFNGREEVMADNKKKRGGADRALIALGERYEVTYWSKKFKVTPAPDAAR